MSMHGSSTSSHPFAILYNFTFYSLYSSSHSKANAKDRLTTAKMISMMQIPSTHFQIVSQSDAKMPNTHHIHLKILSKNDEMIHESQTLLHLPSENDKYHIIVYYT